MHRQPQQMFFMMNRQVDSNDGDTQGHGPSLSACHCEDDDSHNVDIVAAVLSTTNLRDGTTSNQWDSEHIFVDPVGNKHGLSSSSSDTRLQRLKTSGAEQKKPRRERSSNSKETLSECSRRRS